MKYVLLLLFISSVAQGQTTYYIRADSTRLQKVGGNNELIIENSTRSVKGLLTNYGNGRTRFIGSRISNDTLFVGMDTLIIPGSGTIGGSIALNQVAYGSGANTIAGLGLNTGALRVLTQTSSGAPVWTDPTTLAPTASNGITLASNNYKLGGSFVNATTITNAGGHQIQIQLDENDDPTGFVGTNYGGLVGFRNGSAEMSSTVGSNTGVVQASSSTAFLSASTAAAQSSQAVTATSITLYPHLGNLIIDTILTTTDTTNFKPMSWRTSTGQVKQMTYWPGGGGGSADSSWVDVKNYFQAGVTLATSTRQQRIDAWQAAIADAQTKGYGIHYSGWWDIRTDSVVITDKLTIQGVGMYSSLTTTDSMGVCLKIDIPTTRAYYEVIFPTYKPVVLQDFQVLYTGSATPDATSRGIKDNCTNSINFQHRFERITVDSFYTGIELHNIASSHIYECYFRSNRAYGILNTNSESNDYGKLVIDKCVFAVSSGIVGAPDTSAHIKWEGGAGLTVTNNDFYGYSDYAVWVNLKNTTEVFASAGSTEFSFKHNRALFLNDYAFLFDTDFGKGGAGTAFDGNKIEHIQIQDNMTGINGLLKTVGGTASIFDVQVTGNSNVYPYLGTAKIPIVINGLAMTNYTMADNIFNGILFTTGTGFPGITKAVSVTGGSISGVVKACNNTYIGYGTAPDIADTCASPGSWTTNIGTVATLNQASTLAMAGNTFNFSGGNVGIGRTPAVNLDILGASNTYVRATRPNNANDLFTILVPNGALASGNSQYAFGMAGGSANFTLQQYNGTSAFDVISANESTQAITLSSLAGTGSRTVLADASGVLSAPVSDSSVKERATTLQTGLSTIMKLKPVSFYYKKDWQNRGTGIQLGFIAQDIQQVLPNIVGYNKPTGKPGDPLNGKGKLGYDEMSLIPVLVAAVQEQQKQIDELKELVNKLIKNQK